MIIPFPGLYFKVPNPLRIYKIESIEGNRYFGYYVGPGPTTDKNGNKIVIEGNTDSFIEDDDYYQKLTKAERVLYGCTT